MLAGPSCGSTRPPSARSCATSTRRESTTSTSLATFTGNFLSALQIKLFKHLLYIYFIRYFYISFLHNNPLFSMIKQEKFAGCWVPFSWTSWKSSGRSRNIFEWAFTDSLCHTSWGKLLTGVYMKYVPYIIPSILYIYIPSTSQFYSFSMTRDTVPNFCFFSPNSKF